MASTLVYRPAASFLVCCTIFALTGFGCALRIVTKPQPYNKMTQELNVACIADDPMYRTQTIMTIQITRQGQYKPIVIIDMNQDFTMGPNNRGNMQTQGHIDNNSSTSFLTLTITRPGIQDAGPYTCQMFLLDENYQTIKRTATAQVTFDDHGTRDEVFTLLTTIRQQEKQMMTYKDLLSVQNQQIEELKTKNSYTQNQSTILMELLQEQNQTIGTNQIKLQEIRNKPAPFLRLSAPTTTTVTTMYTRRRKVCLPGWRRYRKDRTCVRVFGKDDISQHLSWSKAREVCQAWGGDLVQIRDNRKNKFVHNMIDGNDWFLWIGIKKDDVNSDFKYVDGSPLETYHSWGAGYPHRDGECVAMFSWALGDKRMWGNFNCADKKSYVCSKPYI